MKSSIALSSTIPLIFVIGQKNLKESKKFVVVNPLSFEGVTLDIVSL